jgi:radical SAM protein with 4Fe4S-binding SPASM domain
LCPVGLGIKGYQKGFMSFETFKKVVDDAKKYLIKVYLADWGEPFLNPDVFRMIKYAEEQGIMTSASTNLHFFKNADDFRKLIDSGLSELTISLHGASQKTYETYQPGKSFSETIKKIKLINELKRQMGSSKPVISLAFAVTKKNQHEVRLFNSLAKNLGCNSEIYPASINIRFYMQNVAKLTALIDQWAPNVMLLEKWSTRARRGKPDVIRFYKTLMELRKMTGKITLKLLEDSKITAKYTCFEPWQSMVVNWDGTVSLCCIDFYKYSMGNVHKDNIINIWNNDKYKKVRKFLRKEINVGDIDFPCKYCIKY